MPEGSVITSSSKIGDIEEKINCKVYGDVLDVGFNTKYILDGLRGADAEVRLGHVVLKILMMIAIYM